jgi:hypothetical protein
MFDGLNVHDRLSFWVMKGVYSRLIYGTVKILHLYGIINIPVYAGFFVVID